LPDTLLYYFTTYYYARNDVCKANYKDREISESSIEKCTELYIAQSDNKADKYLGSQYFDMKE